jgi:hypothetical protein
MRLSPLLSRLAEHPAARAARALGAWLERHPTRTVGLICLLFVLAYVAAQVWFPKPPARVIDGDALGYYAWLRSVVVDGDIDFSNDYRLLTDELAEDSEELTPTITGLVPNKWPPGSALLWAPLFLTVGLCISVLNLAGAGIPFDGLALPFKISAGVAGIFYATLGIWLCYDLARRVHPAPAAFWATITLWLAGSPLYYSLVSPTYSHATSLFAIALFAHTWFRTRGRDDVRRFALLGIVGGLAALVRTQDLIVLVLPGIELLVGIRDRRWSFGGACGRLAVLGAACGIALSPQLWAWQVLYGTPVLNPHGGGDYFGWTQPAILQTLFSMRQGLVSWTPVVLLAAIGLPRLVRRDPLLGWASVTVLLLALYVNAAATMWWAGAGFGARRFVGYTPFLAVGLSALLASPAMATRRGLVQTVSTVLICCNVLFLLQYQLFMRGFHDIVASYPNDPWTVFVERFVVPFRLVAAWMN